MPIDQSWYRKRRGAATKVSAGGVVSRAVGRRVYVALARQKEVRGYVLPKGGVDPGEELEQAARREIEEEAGFAELTYLDNLGSLERWNRTKTHWKTTHYFLFLTREVDVTPLEPDRHPKPRWFPLDDLPLMFWPEQRELLLKHRDRMVRTVLAAHDKPHFLHHIDHVNIVVRDMDAMVAFYGDLLGLEVTKDVTISGRWVDQVAGLKGVRAQVIYLGLPAGPRVELIKYQKPAAKKNGKSQSNIPGLRHMAFMVKDIDEAVKRLRKAHVKFLSPIKRVPDSQVTYDDGVRKRLVYLRDPEGNLLELCEYRK